ncbi:MAG: glycosyltransferase [Planctomycetota bacterium]|jgi:glycosyltransferase involved in cell wall biosynthesis
MPQEEDQIVDRRLLVFNCHEAWVYQLGYLGYKLDIVIGLTGRYEHGWDSRMRPIPQNSKLITLDEALNNRVPYYCIITHNVTDLLDAKLRSEPKIMVLHLPIEARIVEEQSTVSRKEMLDALGHYIDLLGCHVVAVSPFKGQSWGFTEDVVVFGIDVDSYPDYSGEKSCGLRISNFIEGRQQFLLWDFHQQAFSGLPVKIVGHNPGMCEVSASKDWIELKQTMQSHRFYIHTADPELEDGFNMATIEAMAAGMPVLGNRHPTSPVKHGVSGFLSDDPAALRKYAKILLEDRELAAKMGEQARKTVIERFDPDVFKGSFLRSIERAREKCKMKSQVSPGPIPLSQTI